jgi:acyl-CoA synthetase (AMP-forming)/AMP-acid ligase II
LLRLRKTLSKLNPLSGENHNFFIGRERLCLSFGKAQKSSQSSLKNFLRKDLPLNLSRPPITIPNESLTFPLRQAARKYSEKIAVICPEAGGKEATYQWLEEHSSILAASLEDLGVAPGDRVALWMKNSLEYILSFYGILKAGAIVVPISTHYGSREVQHQLKITKSRGLIAQGGLLSQLEECLAEFQELPFIVSEGSGPPSLKEVSFTSLLQGPRQLDRSLGIDPHETLAVLPFSSGTTGLPKGVMLTHSNLLSNLYQVIQAHEVSEQDVFINQLPFFHIYGMTVLMGASIMAGATQVLASRFRPLEEFLGLFQTFRPSLFFTVPLILQEFCHHSLVKTMDWSRLRYVNTGGAPLSPEVQERFTQITGVPVMQGYGLTETSPTTHCNPIRSIKVGTIGLPLANTEDKIVDPQTEQEVPSPEVGELWIRGPQIMKGYYQDPEATAQTLVDGWLRTGDLGKKDQEGYVTIVDRLKELIKIKGMQVAPVEIEHILVGHPDIQDAAVIGQPHPSFGEVPVAYVVLRPESGLSPEAIIDYAAAGLAKYKRLTRVVLTDAIPRSPSGKILRRVLKEALCAALSGSPE